MRLLVLLFLCSGLLACGTLPDIPETASSIGADADYAGFVPMDQVILEQRQGDTEALETEEELEARLAGLRVRAAKLRAASVE